HMSLSVAREYPLEHGGVLCTETAAAVDDENQTHQRLTDIEVMLHELQPFHPHPFGDLGESVPGKVDQSAIGRQFKKIDELSTAWGTADPSEARPVGDGVDHRGFAGIGAAGEGDLTA